MARNGSGTYSLVSGNPVTTGSTISSTWANNTLSDIATALTGSIAADGQTPITANLPMSNYKHTGASAASASGQYIVYGQSSASLGDLSITGALNVTGTQTNTGALNLSGTTTATGAVNLSGTTTATGAVNVSGTATVSAAGTLNVSGTMAIVDTNLTFVDGGDTTKKVAFQVSGVTTGTTRTATWPNKDGTVAMTSDVSNITLGTPAVTTSGTTVNLSDIGSGAKSITVSFNGVSTNGTSSILVQVGPSGGVVTTGYVSTAFWANSAGPGSTTETSTAGFLVGRNFAAGDAINGNLRMTLENASTNTWTVNGVINGQSSGGMSFFAGRVSLAGELIKVRLTTVGGTDTFDAGEANNSYQ